MAAALTGAACQQNAPRLAGPPTQQLRPPAAASATRARFHNAVCLSQLRHNPTPCPPACLHPLTSMQIPHFGPSGSASGGGGGGGLRSCCSSSCFTGDSCGGGWIRGRLAPREGPLTTVLRTICRSGSPTAGGLLPVRSTTSGAAPAGRWRCWCCCPWLRAAGTACCLVGPASRPPLALCCRREVRVSSGAGVKRRGGPGGRAGRWHIQRQRKNERQEQCQNACESGPSHQSSGAVLAVAIKQVDYCFLPPLLRSGRRRCYRRAHAALRHTTAANLAWRGVWGGRWWRGFAGVRRQAVLSSRAAGAGRVGWWLGGWCRAC